MKKKNRATKDAGSTRVNNTAHQRAMSNPKVHEILNILRFGLKKLSPRERDEQLNKLDDLGCSIRGIAKELKIPASSLRRSRSSLKSMDSESDWIQLMEGTLAKTPHDEPERSRFQAVREARSAISSRKLMDPVKNLKPPTPVRAFSTSGQRAMRITAPQSAPVKVPRKLENEESALREASEHARTEKPPIDLVDRYMELKVQIPQEKIRRLAEIAESVGTRPYRDARSMKRQGTP